MSVGTIATSDLSNAYDISSLGSLTCGGLKLEGFKTGNLSMTGDTVDNSTRDEQGWASNAPGKRSATLSVTCNKVASGADNETGCQSGLRELYLSDDWQSKAFEVVMRSENNSTSKGTGIKGLFIITNYSESQQAGSEAIEIQMEFQSVGALTADNSTATADNIGG